MTSVTRTDGGKDRMYVNDSATRADGGKGRMYCIRMTLQQGRREERAEFK